MTEPIPLSIGAAYIRVSTDDQTELSPDAQLRMILDAAKKTALRSRRNLSLWKTTAFPAAGPTTGRNSSE